MGEIRWEGHSHEELYRQIHAGPGVAASHVTEDAWANLTTALHEIDENLHNKLKTLGATWEGVAADQAQGNLTPLAQWARDAGDGANVMKVSVVDQANFIAKARTDMPPPVKVTTPAPSGLAVVGAAVAGAVVPGLGGLAIDHVISQQHDHEKQEAAKSAGEQKAYDVMRTYQASSTWNANTLGTFNPPPNVVVDVPPPAGGGYSGAPVGMSTAAGGWMPPPGRPASPGSGLRPTGPGGGWNPAPGPVQPHPVGYQPGPVQTQPVGYQPGPVTGRPGGPSGYPGGPGTGYPVRSPGHYPVAVPPGWGGAVGRSGAGYGSGMSPEEEIARRGGAGGRLGAATEGAGRAGGQGQGRGATVGALGAEEEAAARRGPAGAGAGGRGGSIMQPAVGQGRGGKGEEDGEHHAADYLVENRDIFGDDRMVAPPVIGEDLPQE